MDVDRLKVGAPVDAPTVSASMATALLAYSGIAVKMLIDGRLGAVLHTMFMVEYEPGGVAQPHDHPLEETYYMLEGEVEAMADGDVFTLGPGDVFWTSVGCVHAFRNKSQGKVRWLETQSPQPPANHSYRFNRDWDYLVRAARLALKAVRIATWNVNSVKQRVPRLLPWLDERRPDVVCLQETKLADDAFAELLGEELADRGYEVAAHGEADLERRGDPLAGRAGGRGRAGSPGRRASRTPRRARCPPPATGSGWSRCTCRTGASRTPSTTGTSSPGWPRCGRWSRPARRRRSSAAT